MWPGRGSRRKKMEHKKHTLLRHKRPQKQCHHRTHFRALKKQVTKLHCPNSLQKAGWILICEQPKVFAHENHGRRQLWDSSVFLPAKVIGTYFHWFSILREKKERKYFYNYHDICTYANWCLWHTKHRNQTSCCPCIYLIFLFQLDILKKHKEMWYQIQERNNVLYD